MKKNKNINSVCITEPRALKTLSKDIFIKVPLYKTKQEYGVCYVNPFLFKEIFCDANTNFEHMSKVVAENFSTTIDVKKSNNRQIGFAYVDMQADPFKFGLRGNQGSGRAFYQGNCFNIKGEKTPLAQSKHKEYSNGILEFEKAIYETIVSNSLFQDTSINLSPILAILDIKENYKVTYKSGLCRKAKVIRIDLNGTLNRVSHTFKMKKPMSKTDMLNFTKAIARMEGEKFLQRIEHGAWSTGNLSQNADMIDFDSVCCTKYRCPVYSITPYHIENFFGYEYLGQLHIIKSLVNDKDINKDNLKYKELKRILLKNRMEYIQNNFPKLMGFDIDDPDNMSSLDKKLLNDTSKLFYELARKCYALHENLSTKNLNTYEYSPFDFSNFFRFYPLLKIFDSNSKTLLEYLISFMAEVKNFKLDDFEINSKEDKYLYKNTLKYLDKNYIHSEQELIELIKKSVTFIQLYEKLFLALLKYNHNSYAQIARNAYIVNEDRTGMMPSFSFAGPINDERNKMTYKMINNLLNTVILSNKRNGSAKIGNLYISNCEIYKEGFFAILMDDNLQHKLSINIYNDIEKYSKTDVFSIKVNGIEYPCQVIHYDNIISIQSPFFTNCNLLKNMYNEIRFFKNGTKIKLANYKFIFTKNTFTYDFHDLI